MRGISLRAYAKVNLALEVRGVRADGYHEVATVLQSISLADEVEIERAGGGFDLSVEPEAAEVGPPEDNTVFRAWGLLREFAGEELPVRVRLRKRVPAGAGIGGGSADAAAALVGLNALFGLNLDADDLGEIGLKVGADVPFCLSGGTALGEGIGEILSPLPAPPPHALVVAKPVTGAETARIYRAHDERARESRVRHHVAPVVAALRAGDLNALAAAADNDLAPVTEALVPEVRELRDALLKAGASGAAMSGTGSAVYGVFVSEEAAKEAAEELRRVRSAAFVGVCGPVGRGVEVA